MSRSTHTQREWLVEDLDQIRRYFPGAKFIKPLDTPFDIETRDMSQETRGGGMPLCGKKDWILAQAGNDGGAPKNPRHSHSVLQCTGSLSHHSHPRSESRAGSGGNPVKNLSQSDTTPTLDSYLMALAPGGVL